MGLEAGKETKWNGLSKRCAMVKRSLSFTGELPEERSRVVEPGLGRPGGRGEGGGRPGGVSGGEQPQDVLLPGL